MTAIYYESDSDITLIKDKPIGVLGYGNLGRSIATNLRDSGVQVLVGNIDDQYATMAREDAFSVLSLAEAAASTEIKILMVADEVLPEIYLQQITPSLKTGDALIFASGYNIAFGYIEPPPFVDVLLLAPRSNGLGVRQGFLQGRGFPSFVGVSQDATGRAWDRLLAVAALAGGLRAGAFELSFRQEAEIDLFFQQSLMPVLHNLLTTAADVLIREGYPPEAVLLELYASGELSDSMGLAADHGLLNSLTFLSQTAQYGILSRIERFADQNLRRKMENTLDEIRGGKFAHEWATEYANGYPRLESLRNRRSTLPLWETERTTLDLFQRRPPQSDLDEATLVE